MKSSNIKYLPALDHLRGYAALLIMVYHGILVFENFFATGAWVDTLNPVYALFVEGHTAVSLFMVLSGFIFTFGAYGKRIDYGGFVRNRFLRIYPLFLAVIAAGIYFYPKQVSFNGFLKTFFFYSYAPDALNLGPFSALFWTISVEFQFYLIFPFIFYLMGRYGTRSIFLLIAASFGVKLLCVYQLGYTANFISYWTLAGRIDQFLLGMLAAHIYALGSLNLKRLLVPSAVGVVAMIFIYHRLGGWPAQSGWKLLLPFAEGAAWAAFMLAYTQRFTENTGAWAKAMTFLGERSYSFYLIHLVVWFYFYRNGLLIRPFESPLYNSFANSALIVLPATLAISTVTYALIERPFLRLRVRYLKPASERKAEHSPAL